MELSYLLELLVSVVVRALKLLFLAVFWMIKAIVGLMRTGP